MSLFRFSSLSKRRGATVAGIFSVALGSVLLLCGAGSAPIENLLPQGAMQGDLNAGGFSLTNAATVQATNAYVNALVVTNSFTPPSSFTSEFEPALGNPGTDGYVLSSTASGVRSWIAAGSGGSISLGSNASGAGFTFSSGTLDLSSAVNTFNGLLQLDYSGALAVPMVNNLSINSGLNGLFWEDAAGDQIDLTGYSTGSNDSIGLYAADGAAIHLGSASVLSVGTPGLKQEVIFGGGGFTLSGSGFVYLVAPPVGGPALFFAYNPMSAAGDLTYGGATSYVYNGSTSSPVANPTRLAGNTTSLVKFLSQTGTGSSSAAPTWSGLSIISDFSPTTGATVNAGTSGADETLYLTPSGTLAALTISLPSAANSQVGQIERCFISQIITTLTVSVSGSGTVDGPSPVTSAADSSFAYQCVSTSGSGTWIRLY